MTDQQVMGDALHTLDRRDDTDGRATPPAARGGPDPRPPALVRSPAADLDQWLARHQTSRAALREALDLSATEVAYASGSVTDGLGDAHSDLDLFVVTDDAGFARRRPAFATERRRQQQRHGFGIVYVSVGPMVLDVEVHHRDRIHEVLGALADLDPADDDHVAASFCDLGPWDRDQAQSFLHRLRVGACVGDPETYAALRASFDEANFLRWFARLQLIDGRDFIQGARRSMAASDWQNACLKLQRAFAALADALLFLEDDSLDRWKWRLPKLRRGGQDAFLAAFLTIHLHVVHTDLPTFLATKLAEAQSWLARLMARVAQ